MMLDIYEVPDWDQMSKEEREYWAQYVENVLLLGQDDCDEDSESAEDGYQ